MKPITIIGGGLAGLSLGIGLREAGVPTRLIEAGQYPRHRVCGEFISGRGAEIARRLINDLPGVSHETATTAAFFTSDELVMTNPLPKPAVCVSRFALDAALCDRFVALGGELQLGERWRGEPSEGVVLASGRRAQPTDEGWRWFGLKVHVRNVRLAADLEMHLAENSYVGLCRLPGGEVNVCGLFRRRMNDSGSGACKDWLRGATGSLLQQRLQGAEFDEASFCAVAGLSLKPQQIVPTECRIGDALTMIPPITGNGMSMAFESAEAALAPMRHYSRGDLPWTAATAGLAHALQQMFSPRLRSASWMQRALFSPIASAVLPTLLRRKWFWRRAFSATR